MENYVLKQRMGKGAQGSVFLVESRADKAQYVLKKVECNDEAEANKAFKEAMALQELQHPYVCGYKEFFVTWDKEESAMFVCIVMDYYKMGDMDRVLKKKRVKQEEIEELVLKKWLGQMVEALVFVHKKKVIHRDLKPSNIFLTEELNVSIGDFGVATVMGDARTRTRTTVGSMIWMAPEVLERPYDERSDVWSLGCIVLEMATCGTKETSEVHAVLFEIKQSPVNLEETLEEIGKKYSADLCQLIRTMLRRNFQQRPTAVELVELPYIKECLLLSNSALVNKKKEKQRAAKDPPTDQGVAGVMSFMKENADNEISIANALKQLNTYPSLDIDEEGKKLIIQNMKMHMSEATTQIQALRVLLTLAAAVDVEEDSGNVVFSLDVISAITLAMKAHASSKELQCVACLLLKTLAMSEDAAGVIGQRGGIQDVLAAMRSFPNDAEVCANCCAALSCLTISDKNLDIIREEKGVVDLINAMKTHDEKASVVDSACTALWGLSLDDENAETMSEYSCAELLLSCIKMHAKNADVMKNACMALASLVSESEESAFAALSNGGGEIGIKVVTDAYKNHKDNPDVVENVCSFFMEMCEYDDILNDVKSSDVAIVMKEVKVKFASNTDIMDPVQQVEAKIGIGPTPSNRPQSARDKAKAK
ncbi:serine/threonine kinase-like domain-containing protein STKLD1 [Amphiura filiformis]|uniref:serine/threonine kinase-like domain-containing protein STKLD1 n=1 Tax=Amphiura filiformis TaxID=82378 RepID=UPI003B211E7C